MNDSLKPAGQVFPRERIPPSIISRPILKKTSEKLDTFSQPLQARGSLQRSDRIMDMLKVGGMLGIKDISTNLPQYSEKMIQRELAELVTSGRVRKLGAKRWSRYEIVQ